MTATDAMREVQANALNELITERNKKVSKINAAQGDKDAIAEGVVNSDDDPEVVRLRNEIAELQDALDVIVDAKVKEILSEGAENVDTLKDEVTEDDKTIRSGLNFFKKLYGDDAVKELTKMDRLKGARTGGAGGKRIRGYDVEVTLDDETTAFNNFAGAAKFLGTDTALLQEQFFAKAGVEKLKDAPDEVQFGLSWTEQEEDGSTTNRTATVKAVRTGPSGLPESDDADDSDVSDADEVEVDEDDLEGLG